MGVLRHNKNGGTEKHAFVCFSVPNTFVALCNVYVLPLAPKTKESVFSKRAGPFFCCYCSIFQNLSDYLAEIFENWQNFTDFATFQRYICYILKFFADFSRKLLIFQTDFFAKI